VAEGFGAIIYNKDTNLTLNAEKVQLVSTNPTYLYGNITFYNFYCDTPDKEIYFEAGYTYSFYDSLTIVGAADQGAEEYYIKLYSQNPGEYYYLNVTTQDYLLERVVVQDCYAIEPIIIPKGIDYGNNYNLEIDPVWDGGGADNNWSTALNWDGNAIPTGTQTVTFGDAAHLDPADPYNKDCTINNVGGWAGGNFTITSYYTGTITQEAALSCATFSQAGGTFNTGNYSLGSGNMNISGGTFNGSTGQIDISTFGLSGGIFNAPSNLNVYGDWSVTGGTFNHNNGTVTLLGYASKTLNSGEENFYNLYIPLPYYNITNYNNLIVEGYLTISSRFDANNYDVTVNGLTTLEGAVYGEGIYYAGTGKQTFNGGLTILNGIGWWPGALTCSSGEVEINGNFTMSNGSFTGSTGNVDINGDVIISGGVFTAPTGNFTVSGNWSKTGGTFNHNNGTVTFDAGLGNTQTLNSGASNFYNLTHSGAGILQLNTNALGCTGNLTNSAGTFDANALGVGVSGRTTISGGEYKASTATQYLNGGLTVSGGTFTGGSGDVVIIGTWGAGNGLLLSSGTLTAPSGTMYVALSFDITGGTFNHNNGTVRFYGGGGSADELQSNGQHFYNIVSEKTGWGITLWQWDLYIDGALTVAGTGNFYTWDADVTVEGLTTITSGTYYMETGHQTLNGGLTINGGTLLGQNGSIDLNGNLTLSSGSLTAPSGNFTVSGNWYTDYWNGTFTPGTNTVTFDAGNGITQTIYQGNSSFYNIIHSGAGTLQVVTGSLTAANNFTNSAGVFDANGYSYSVGVSGTAIISGGEYLAKTGTQTFNNSLTISGGTFTCSSGAVTVANILTISGGTFNGSSGNLTLGSGDPSQGLILTSGTFKAPSSAATFTVSGSWSVTGGTFNHNNGTVKFTGNGPNLIYTLDSGGQSFYNFISAEWSWVGWGHSTLRLENNALTVEGTYNQTSGAFDANGQEVTITGLATIKGVESYYYAGSAKQTFNGGVLLDIVQGNYSGHIYCSSGEVEINGTLTNAGGFYGSTGIVDINGDIDMQGGEFTASSTTTYLSGNFTWAPSIDPNGGTFVFDGGGTSQIGVSPFYNISITNGTTLSPILYVGLSAENISVINGTLDMATNDNSLTVTGTLTIFSGANYYTGTDNQNIATLDNSGNVTCNNEGIYYIHIGNMTNNDGSLWTYTKDSGSVLVLTGTYHDLTFNDGGGSAAYFFSGTNYITGTLTVSGGTCRYAQGDDSLNVTEDIVNNDEFNITAGTLNLSGNLINNGTFTSSDSTVAFNGTTIISGPGTNSFDNVTINGDLTAPSWTNINVAGNWTSSDSGHFYHNNGTVTFNGTTTLSGSGNTYVFYNIIITGTLTAPPFDMYVTGDWTNNGTFIHNNGGVSFTYGFSTTISGSSENSFYNFKIGQTVNAPSGNMNIAGNWTNFGYTFNHNNGTVTFNGSGNSTITGSTTFYNFTCTTAGKTLRFVSGTTQTIEGTFTLTGTSGNLITLLRSSGSGTNQWYIDPQGTRNVTYVDVQNSNNINTTIINARHSTDSGNNINWFFIPSLLTWTGAVSTDWDTAANWDNNFTPEAGDSAIITDVANDPILATAVTINNLTINSDAILDLNAKNLTLAGTFTNNGTLKLVGSETLTGFTNDADSGITQYYGTGTYSSLAAGNTYYDLVISNSGTYSINNNLTVNGNLTISNASANLNLNGHNASFATTSVFSNEGKLRLQGSEVLTNFNNDTDSGTVEYYGVGPYTGLAAGNTYYNLMLSGGTITLTANLDINGTLSFGQGTGYAYYKSITIDHTKVDEALTDYPLLFSVTDSELAGTGSGGYVTNANGYDIIFKDADGNLLDFEIEHYDSATGQYIAWVKIPTVLDKNQSDNTVIYMYFANNSITSSQENVAGVWSSGYQAVWHYDDAAGSGTVEDSTGNYDGTVQGSATQGSTGLIGTAVTLNNGSNDYITVSSTAAIANSSTSTLEVWVNASSQAVIYGFYSETAAAPNPNGVGYLFFKYDLYGGVMFATATDSGGVYLSSATSYPDSTWTQFVCVFDGTNLTFYKDGSLLGTTAGTASDSTINDINIGSFNGYFKGLLDEMRTSTVARSSGWISTQYNNQSNPGGFSTEGSKQASSSSVTLTTAGFDVNIAGDISNTYNTGIVSGTGTVIFDGTGTSTVTGTTTLPNVEISLNKTVDLNGSNITFGGTFVNNGTLKLIGSETLTGFVNDTDSGIVEYTGNGTYASLSGGNNYYDLTISGTGSFTAASDLAINNDFTQNNGTFIAPSNMDISGNFTQNSGTFNANGGTVTFTDNSQPSTLSGDTTFNNLTCTTAGKSLVFTAGSTQEVDGLLTLTGSAGNLISLR
ncbi:MAG: DUF2341 domain-containing protein, partial [Bacteroidetes bacterium]|nr:DUF2341 domain-containing protein [Bacteroidota bacterium]